MHRDAKPQKTRDYRSKRKLIIDRERILPLYAAGRSLRQMSEETGLTIDQCRQTIAEIQTEMSEAAEWARARLADSADDAVALITRFFVADRHGAYLEAIRPEQSGVAGNRLKAAIAALGMIGVTNRDLPEDVRAALLELSRIKSASEGETAEESER